MKNTSILALTLILISMLSGCSPIKIQKNNNSNQQIYANKKQDSLAFELCQIYGLDQGVRRSKGMPNKWRFIHPIDSMNFFKILDFTKTHGFPNKELLGEQNFSHECVQAAAYAVLLHMPHMLINNKEYLDVFVNEMNDGNLREENLILFLDKYYYFKKDQFGNRKLLYGSQFGKPCKKYRKQSDSVRAIIGLKPLPDSLFIDCKTSK